MNCNGHIPLFPRDQASRWIHKFFRELKMFAQKQMSRLSRPEPADRVRPAADLNQFLFIAASFDLRST